MKQSKKEITSLGIIYTHTYRNECLYVYSRPYRDFICFKEKGMCLDFFFFSSFDKKKDRKGLRLIIRWSSVSLMDGPLHLLPPHACAALKSSFHCNPCFHTDLIPKISSDSANQQPFLNWSIILRFLQVQFFRQLMVLSNSSHLIFQFCKRETQDEKNIQYIRTRM